MVHGIVNFYLLHALTFFKKLSSNELAPGASVNALFESVTSYERVYPTYSHMTALVITALFVDIYVKKPSIRLIGNVMLLLQIPNPHTDKSSPRIRHIIRVSCQPSCENLMNLAPL